MTEIISVRFKNGGKQYYFNPVSDGTKGRMAEDTVLEDGTRVGKDGAKTE